MPSPAAPTPSGRARRRRPPDGSVSRPTTRGTVLFGDVVGSRRYPRGATAWLRSLAATLDERYREDRLARFEFTQGDEIQGLLRPDADPLDAILHASLAADAPQMRWAIVAGMVEPGEGPATRRTGPAFIEARALIELARKDRDGLLVRTQTTRADDLLDATAPVLAELLDRLTERQRTVARLLLVDGRNQAEAADHLGVSRATISVSYQRAGLRSISRLLHAVREIFAEGAHLAQPGDTVTS